ncbi:hypothetical protein PATSB16_12130 [Pandoraea thiooxydans]|uniref:DUF4148 domain-containing protein n=1 Tax=Pandoraea thiooxydans TaxID=445709 RepID=A0A0G3END6_9BURK|nr:DUF4148 domain-containing protein [Pandoraea thiooxydans]AKJ67499.1 hypothetical protein ABW99_03900 [Pandoraea thiooxydans]APR94555.1 hypothetical protein PATSB16_12130 [Pandoraea thiooxydans]
MKRNLLAAALLSALLAGAAGSAMASDAYPDGSQLAGIPAASALSRAQVKSELAQARAAGALDQSDIVYPRAVAVAQSEAVMRGGALMIASNDSSNISPQP